MTLDIETVYIKNTLIVIFSNQIPVPEFLIDKKKNFTTEIELNGCTKYSSLPYVKKFLHIQ